MTAPIDTKTIRALLSRATPGPYFYDSYSRIISVPRANEYEAISDATSGASDADWEAIVLPEPVVASVPCVSGDTATAQGRADALYLEALMNAIGPLLAEVEAARACIEEIRRISGPTRIAVRDTLAAYDAATKGAM